jgi:hypothetical protein
VDANHPDCEFSPEALSARLGPEVYAFAVQAAMDAPAPSAAKVEAVRRILAPAVALVMEEQKAKASHA